jgi:hypothetical protein
MVAWIILQMIGFAKRSAFANGAVISHPLAPLTKL